MLFLFAYLVINFFLNPTECSTRIGVKHSVPVDKHSEKCKFLPNGCGRAVALRYFVSPTCGLSSPKKCYGFHHYKDEKWV